MLCIISLDEGYKEIGMLRIRTRITALLLSLALLSGITSCGKEDYSGKILTCADYISEYAVERKYVEIAAMSLGSDPDLREFMSMSSDSATIYRAQLAIESTLKYDVLEDTLECYGSDMTGSIDVEFTYCDYEEVLDSVPIFLSMDDFEEAVYNCTEQIEVTLTYEFQYVDGLVKLTNIKDLNELFPYKDIEVPISLGYASYIGDPEFMGDTYDNNLECYLDTESIIAVIPIDGDGHKLIWDYYYEIESGREVVYTSDPAHDEYPNSLYINYDFGSSIPNGFYDFTLYDLEGTEFKSFTIYVTGSVDPIRYLGGTTLYYELPEGYGYADPNTYDMSDRFGNMENFVDAYITGTTQYSYGYDLVIARNLYHVDQSVIDDFFAGLDADVEENYSDLDATIHRVNYTFTIDGVEYSSATYFIETGDEYYDVYYFVAVFNYEGETFVIDCICDDYDALMELLSGFHTG